MPTFEQIRELERFCLRARESKDKGMTLRFISASRARAARRQYYALRGYLPFPTDDLVARVVGRFFILVKRPDLLLAEQEQQDEHGGDTPRSTLSDGPRQHNAVGLLRLPNEVPLELPLQARTEGTID